MPLGMVPSSDVSLLLSSVTGNPEVKRAMPATAHPEANACSAGPALSVGQIDSESSPPGCAAYQTKRVRGSARVHWIHRLGQAGGLIDGLRIRIAGKQLQPVRAVVERGFKRVVAGVGDGALQLDAAECRAELGARGLLVERSAGRAQGSGTAPDRPGLPLPAPADDATKRLHS